MSLEASERFESSRLKTNQYDSLLKSPDTHTLASQYRSYSGSVLKTKDDKLTESALAATTRIPGSVQKRTHATTEASSPKASFLRTAESRVSRHLGTAGKEYTPRRIHFYSDYLKDYDPTPAMPKYLSPVSKELKREILETNYRHTGDEDPFRTKLTSGIGVRPATERSVDKRDKVRGESDYVSKRLSPGVTPDRAAEGSYKGYNDSKEHKVRSIRKDEIRSKLSKLSEKLYSPIKSNQQDTSRIDLPDTSAITSLEPRDIKTRREPSVSFLTGDRSYLRADQSQIGVSRYDPIDTRPRLESQQFDTTAASLKEQLQSIEKRHEEQVRKLRDELREAKEALYKERSENTTRANNEIRTLNDRIKELERNLQQEVEKAQLQEQKLEQNKIYYEKKINELKEEANKIREEKDKKIQELNNLLKTQNKNHRDALNQMKSENEAFLHKMKEENNFLLKDLATQLEKKNAEIERLKKEKTESVNSLTNKTANLQDVIRNLQDMNDQLKVTIEQKNTEIQKLNKKVNEAKKEFAGIKNEVELLEREKSRLAEENEKLKSKVSRLDHIV